VGIFNETFHLWHTIFAVPMFVGIAADLFLTTVTMALQIHFKMAWPRLGDYLVFMAIIYTMLGFVIYLFVKTITTGLDLVEWIVFHGLMGWILGYVLVTIRTRPPVPAPQQHVDQDS
jgi:uncharacterized membrane protein YedE/YeeE